MENFLFSLENDQIVFETRVEMKINLSGVQEKFVFDLEIEVKIIDFSISPQL